MTLGDCIGLVTLVVTIFYAERANRRARRAHICPLNAYAHGEGERSPVDSDSGAGLGAPGSGGAFDLAAYSSISNLTAGMNTLTVTIAPAAQTTVDRALSGWLDHRAAAGAGAPQHVDEVGVARAAAPSVRPGRLSAMTEVFHVARRADPNGQSNPHLPSLAPGTVLDVVEPGPTTFPGGLEAIGRRYPHGVTSHGGRYLSQLPGGEQLSWATEAVFEAVRLAEHSDKPSRMTSCFASASLEEARAFVGGYSWAYFADIWRAEGEILHRANMALLNVFNMPVVAALERASAYWQGEQGPALAAWELLMAPGMTLIEIVETTGHQVTQMPGVGAPL